jgi:hypothetical protein
VTERITTWGIHFLGPELLSNEEKTAVMDIFARDPGVLVAILASYWHAVRRTEAEASLKQDMINRGLSVDEIERVIKATNSPPEVITEMEYNLIEKLVDEGKTAEEIERILLACKASPAALSRAKEAAQVRG